LLNWVFFSDHKLQTISVTLKNLSESDFEDLEVRVEKICCAFCEEEFFIPANLDLHVLRNHQSATQDQPEKCLFCSKSFKIRNAYRKHLELSHQDEAIRCKYRQCFAAFKTEKCLDEHVKKQHSFIKGINSVECKVCKIWLSDKYRLKSHMDSQHATQADNLKAIQCKICSENFDSKAKLRRHTKENHEKEATMCRHKPCHLYFNFSEEMEKHFKNAHQINCKFCLSIFTSNEIYFKHLKKSHLEKKCKFSLCAFYADSKNDLENHLKEKHTRKFKKFAECVYCEKNYSDRKHMFQHVRRYHSKIAIKCVYKICGLFFKSQEELEKHKKEAHKNVEKYKQSVECFYCQKVIWDKQCYAAHIKNHHSKEAIRCKYPQCFTFFKSEEDRQKHLEEKHGGKYSCPLCDYKSMTQTGLNFHVKKHELSVVKCPHCPKMLSLAQLYCHVNFNHRPKEKCPHCKEVGTNLIRHVVTTICPVCSQPFPCKKLFSNHKLKCKKVHKCLECGKTFKIAYNLKHHINLRHKSGQKWRG